jgi:uncharacterized protein
VILVDAGPLIALLSSGDEHHKRCRAALQSLREPIATAWPVLTEAMHLLRFSWAAQDGLLDMIDSGALDLVPLTATDVPRIRQLMHKYRELPMDLADAALVTVAEREGIARIFTLDRRDFEMYRPAKLGRFSLIP